MYNNITILEERTIFYHEPMSCWVARIRGIGLTVYGDTREEAAEKIERMLESALRYRRREGLLEEWLKGLTERGVKWVEEAPST